MLELQVQSQLGAVPPAVRQRRRRHPVEQLLLRRTSQAIEHTLQFTEQRLHGPEREGPQATQTTRSACGQPWKGLKLPKGASGFCVGIRSPWHLLSHSWAGQPHAGTYRCYCRALMDGARASMLWATDLQPLNKQARTETLGLGQAEQHYGRQERRCSGTTPVRRCCLGTVFFARGQSIRTQFEMPALFRSKARRVDFCRLHPMLPPVA